MPASTLAPTVATTAVAVEALDDSPGEVSRLAELAGLGADPIPRARYVFTTKDGPECEWYVRKMFYGEGLSQPYELTLDLATEDGSADTDALLGAQAQLMIERDSHVRNVTGIIHEVDYLGGIGGRLLVRVHIGPALTLLGQRIETRIWQNRSPIDIVKEVLTTGFKPFDRKVDVDQLKGKYENRDYCVQYNESDLEFVHRLLEEEGVTYYFVQKEDANEVMVLVDRNETFPEIECFDGSNEVPVIEVGRDVAETESISAMDWRKTLRSTSLVHRDYDWRRPKTKLEYPQPGKDARNRDREVYVHSDRRWIVEDGKALGERTLLGIAVGCTTGRGESNVTAFSPGHKFKLTEHGRPDLDGDYILTRVVHQGDCPEAVVLRDENDGREIEVERYSNHFECIPKDVTYRPEAKTPKPRVLGPQTATVVGAPEEEIDTDEHGRIKVQFHWDRLGKFDDKSTCWIRTAQAWSGQGWGTFFLPRIGMEVMVEFLEGNPDRPLVTGCVYNGLNPPPYSLPGDKTKSTIKSNSTPGGEGFNEFRFEDAKDSEEVFLHAQKDFNEMVLNNHSTTVNANQTNTVKKNQTESVGGDQTMSVTGKRTATVDKDEEIHVKGNQAITIDGGGEGSPPGGKLTITGDYIVDVSNLIHVKAPTSITLECGGSKLVMEPGKITVTAGDGAELTLDANALMKAQPGAQMLLDANALVQSNPGAKMVLDANAAMESTGQAKIVLDSDALVQCNATATLEGAKAIAKSKGPAHVTLEGPNATMEGVVAKVAGAGASVQLTAEATIMGAKVSLN